MGMVDIIHLIINNTATPITHIGPMEIITVVHIINTIHTDITDETTIIQVLIERNTRSVDMNHFECTMLHSAVIPIH